MFEEEKCYICGISEEEFPLFEGFDGKDRIKICESCSRVNSDIVIMKKPTISQLRVADRPLSVFERLSKAAGLKLTKEELAARDEVRRREEQIALAKLKAKQSELVKADTPVDFSSRRITIGDIKKLRDEMFGRAGKEEQAEEDEKTTQEADRKE